MSFILRHKTSAVCAAFVFTLVTTVMFAMLLMPVKQSYADTNYDNSRWMTPLMDSVKLGYLTVPGTHDASAYNIESGAFRKYAKCQYLNYEEQLRAGVRIFDLRYYYKNGQFYLYHGKTDLSKYGIHTSYKCLDSDGSDLTMDKIFAKFQRFLQANPGEALFPKVQLERGDTHAAELNDLYRKYNLITNYNQGMRLEQFRGRMVLTSGSWMGSAPWSNNKTSDTNENERLAGIEAGFQNAAQIPRNYTGDMIIHTIATNLPLGAAKSSDLKRVLYSPEKWASKINPRFTKNPTPFQQYGQRAYGNINMDFMTNEIGNNIVRASDWAIARNATVSFSTGPGTPIASYTMLDGKRMAKPEDPSANGYTFGGWYKDSACTKAWNFDSDFVIGNTTIYAKWIPNVYNIKYELNGGYFSTENPSKYTFAAADKLGEAAKDDTLPTGGWAFGGWYLEEDFSGSKLTKVPTRVWGDITLYAKWIPTYNIKYELDSGTNDSTNPARYTFGVGVSKFAEPTRRGCTFDGWYFDSSFALDQKVKSIPNTQEGVVTLYAKWIYNKYNIQYITNGGTNSPDNPATYTYNIGIDMFSDPTRDGYSFAGWYADGNYTTPIYTIGKDTIDLVRLYAKWGKQYTITYELDGGTNGSNPSAYTSGVGISSFANPTKLNYGFAGWYSDPEFRNRVYSIADTEEQDITLYAKWAEDLCDIVYNLGSNRLGEVIDNSANPEYYAKGTGVAKFADPIRAGYKFIGWYDGENTIGSKKVEKITEASKGTVVLYARWSDPLSYNITYNLNGGTNDSRNVSTYTFGARAVSFYSATRDNYTFDGWYLDENFSQRIYRILGYEEGERTLYAKWIPNTYSIKYNFNGGTSVDNPSTYTYTQGIESFASPTRKYYTFAGWYFDQGLTQPAQNISETQSGDVTLYAKWTPNDFAINYHLDGGTNADSNPQTYTYTKGVVSFAKPTKEGYNFEGWYEDEDCNLPTISISAQTTDEVNIYAKWSANTYLITYNYDFKDVAPDGNPIVYTAGVGVEKFNDPQTDHYQFGGWYTDAAYTQKIESIPATQIGNVCLYAKWNAGVYSIDYILDEGTNAADNPEEYTYGIGADLQDPQRDRHEFLGWYLDQDYSTKIDTISKETSGNLYLYAKWQQNVYDITYNLDGGINSAYNPSEYTCGTETALENPKRNRYQFMGWYLDQSYTTKVNAISKETSGNITLYAKWQADVYNITYNLNGGTNSADNPSTYVYGEGVSSFAAPIKEGYIFKGWYKNSTFTSSATSITVNQSGDCTLYAKWEAIPVTPEIADIEAQKVGSKPEPVVTLDGKTLVKGTDYSVYWKNYEKAGTATVVVTPKGTIDGWTVVLQKDYEIIAPASWVRLSGGTALSTMKAIVNKGWDSSEWAVVATSEGYQDALSASALAGLLENAPVLLTKTNELSSQTKSMIEAKGVKNVVIVGGTAAVSSGVENAIKALGCSVERIAGGTAITTAMAVYNYGLKHGGWGSDAIIATSDSYQDALSIAPYAYAKHAPILLTDRGTKDIRPGIAGYINQGAFTRTLIIGGTSAVSSVVDSKVKGAKRLSGGTAYSTSTAVANFCLENGMSALHMGAACGTTYQDALVGASFLGKLGCIIVLIDDVNTKNVDSVIAEQKENLSECYIFGGTAAVSSNVLVKVLAASE